MQKYFRLVKYEKPTNSENRHGYYKYGEARERAFVRMMKKKGHNVHINPAKKLDKTAIDLVWGNSLVELKSRQGPFFLAKKHGVGIDPNFAVPINTKDVVRYKDRLGLGSEFKIAIWADWPAETRYGVTVEGTNGVWMTTLGHLLTKIEEGAPVHEYKLRKEDSHGHAKDSYYFDLRDMEKIL